MHFEIEACLTYDLAAPCKVFLLATAEHGQDWQAASHALTDWPPRPASRIDPVLTGDAERRWPRRAGSTRIIATVETAPVDDGLASAAEMTVASLPGDVAPFVLENCYRPSTHLTSFVESEFDDLQGGEKVAAILARIADRVDYRPEVSHAATTAVDTRLDRVDG